MQKESQFKLVFSHRPALDPDGPLRDREYFAFKFSGPSSYGITEPNAQAYGFWFTQEEDEETIKQRVRDTADALIFPYVMKLREEAINADRREG